jgi:hypothetical protein
MFCSSCGAEVLGEMSYCNRCGANLKPLANQSAALPPGKAVGAAWAVSAAVAAVTLGGFALIFAMVMAMISRGIALKEGGLLLIFAALMVILLIDGMLIRQLPRLLARTQLPDDADKTEPKRKLKERTAAPQLVAPPRPREHALREPPLSSVTDHTTRTFDPVYRERDTQR